MATTGYYTIAQMINAKLMIDKERLDSAQIKDMIQRDMQSTEKAWMLSGANYYGSRHDILDHQNYYYIDGNPTADLLKSNARLPHPFHKILVDQKIAYVAGQPIVVSVAEPDVVDPKNPTVREKTLLADADKFEELLHDELGNDFDDLINGWIKGSGNKGVEWLHFYVDHNGEMKFLITPAEGIIPIYDSQYQEDLVYVIRYYTYQLITEKGEAKLRYKVEWWSKTTVEYWAQLDDDAFVHDPYYEYNPAYHWYDYNTTAQSEKIGHGWGRVPFVCLKNNDECHSDLRPIKELVDAYDRVASGWVNDLVDFQELVYVLKGYEAITNEAQQGLSELGIFMQNLKTHKVISVEATGDVTTLKAEIPVEAKEKFLQITRKAIFYFGQGVDVDNEKFDTASGIALKFLYAGLDMKANTLIRKLKKALTEAMYFIVQDINSRNRTSYDPEELIFTINKSVIFNEKEKIDELAASETMLSQQTLLENHPLVDDVEEELNRLSAEKEERLAEALVSLENVQPDETVVTPDGNVIPAPAPPGPGQAQPQKRNGVPERRPGKSPVKASAR